MTSIRWRLIGVPVLRAAASMTRAAPGPVRLVDVSESAGLAFVYQHSPTAQK